MRPKNQQGEEGTFKMSCDRRLVVFKWPCEQRHISNICRNRRLLLTRDGSAVLVKLRARLDGFSALLCS